MKIFFPVLIALLFSFCCNESKQDKEMIIENNPIHPIVHRMGAEQLLNVDKMEIYDSLSVFINRKTDSIFSIYDSSNFTYRGTYGMRGNGPNDFQIPFFLKKPDTHDGMIYLYDVGAAAFRNIQVEKWLNSEKPAIISMEMPAMLIGSPDLHRKADSCYVGNIDSGSGLYFIYDPEKDSIRWVDFPDCLQQSQRDFTVMNRNRITLNFESNSVVSAMGYYNLIFLYDSKAALLKTVQLGPDEIVPKVVDGYHITEDSWLCCADIASSEKEVYVLEQHIREEDFEKVDNHPSRIVVFDWNLKYLKTYLLPHYSLGFVYDKFRHRILYTTLNPEGGTDIYFFYIDGIPSVA